MNPLSRFVVAAVGLASLVGAYLIPSANSQFSEQASEYAVDVNPLPLTIACPGSFVEVAGRSGTEVGSIRS